MNLMMQNLTLFAVRISEEITCYFLKVKLYDRYDKLPFFDILTSESENFIHQYVTLTKHCVNI